MRRLLSRRVCLVCLVLPLILGCGGSHGNVSGTVSYRNKTLEAGTVLLFTEQGKIYSCLIGADGAYKLCDVPPGPARLAVVSHGGVPPGLHMAAPATHPPYPGPVEAAGRVQAAERKPLAIPEKYCDPAQSGLALHVAAGDQAFNIVLRP